MSPALIRCSSMGMSSAVCAIALAVVGCRSSDGDATQPAAAHDARPTAPSQTRAPKSKPPRSNPGKMMRRMATLEARSGSGASGKVFFEARDGKVLVTADVSGLQPGEHGIHLHERGDCSAADAASAGEPTTDLGGLTAGEDGAVREVRTVAGISVLAADPLSIAGRAVVIHAPRPSGARARVACGVVR